MSRKAIFVTNLQLKGIFSFFLPNTNAQAHVNIHISMFVINSNMAFILRCNLRSVSFCLLFNYHMY